MSEFHPRIINGGGARSDFLANLSHFIIESGNNGWAVDVAKVKEPERLGFKEITYQKGDWLYRDSYAGYFMAPGSSVVYHKNRPVWYMTYGGNGLAEAEFGRAKEIYAFLRRALLKPVPELPIRGPINYLEDKPLLGYEFSYDGDLANASWKEQIYTIHGEVFSQRGDAGIIIDKTDLRQPIYPWD